MNKQELIIGVTGTGSLIGQAIIKSIKKSYLTEKFSINLIGFDYISATVGSYWCNKNFILPDHFYEKEISEETWLTELIRQINENKISVLFLGIDFELPLFAKHKAFIEKQTGATIIVSNEDVVKIADDKYLTYSFLKANNLQYPLTYLPHEFKDGMLPYPFIIKPRIGARSVGVHTIHNYDEYIEKSKLVKNPLIQEMIGNTNSEFTCGVISFEDGIHDMIALRRSLKEGNTFKATYKKNTPEIIYSYLKDVCIKLKPYGACNFQLRIDNSGQPKIFEINARHSGTTYMRALLGFNEIEYIIEHTLKLEHKPFHLKEATVVRYFDEFVTEQ
jgi:carbamoyl-phosphate synthase large subunit